MDRKEERALRWEKLLEGYSRPWRDFYLLTRALVRLGAAALVIALPLWLWRTAALWGNWVYDAVNWLAAGFFLLFVSLLPTGLSLAAERTREKQWEEGAPVVSKAAEIWLDAAVQGVRFGRDRRAVRRELREHLADKTADMARVFQIDGEEAELEALKRMGDPEEISAALARAHSPWPGRVWMTSRVVRGMLLTLAVLYLVMGRDYHGDAITSNFGSPYDPPAAAEPACVRLGDYDFRLVYAKLRLAEEGRDLCVMVRGEGPRFWERVEWDALECRVTAPDGEHTPELPVWSTAHGPFSRDAMLWFRNTSLEAGDWVTVELGFPIGTGKLSAQVGEEAS